MKTIGMQVYAAKAAKSEPICSQPQKGASDQPARDSQRGVKSAVSKIVETQLGMWASVSDCATAASLQPCGVFLTFVNQT